MMNTASEKSRSALSGFTARVDGAHLADLIQMNCQKRIRCVFRIISGERSGYLFFDDGLVLHASFGEQEGVEAVSTMLGLDTGTFEPSEQEWPAEPGLKLPADVLLLNAAKRLDEQRSSDARTMPDSQVVKIPSVTPGSLRNPQRASQPAASTQRRGPSPSKMPVPANDAAPDSLSPPSSLGLPMVHLSKTGELIASKGDAPESLVDATAFTHRLACLAGEALGLGPCRAVYMTSQQRGLIVFQARADAVVGATGGLDQLGYLVKKAGL